METYEFNEQAFVESYLDDYSSNDDIAAIDDICCVLDGEYDEDKAKRLAKEGYFAMAKEELRLELRNLERKVLRQAFEDYLKYNY